MTREEIFERVRQSAADVFGVLPQQLQPASSQDDVPGWDSIGHVNLIMRVEAEFGLSFSMEEIPALVSLDILCDTLAELLA